MEKTKIKKWFSPLLIVLGILLCVYVLSMLALFYWGGITSFKDGMRDLTDFARNRGFGFPKIWKTENYSNVFDKIRMPAEPGKTVGFGTIIV